MAKWVCLHEDAQPSGPSASSGERSLRQTPDVSALTRGMSKGDEMAYRIFYDAYFDRLLRYLLVVTAGEEEAAREALQLALVRVTRHIKVFEAEEKFWSWLTVLARSALTDERRKRGRYFAFLRRFASHSELEGIIKYDGEADETLGALLKAKLALLPDDEKQLIEQKYTARRSVREIAEECQTTEKAVESKLSRIRRKLKDAVLMELKNEQPR
ncbi:MAG TPA: sigma-70 family RNA polymerase sigma factor [Verrucomicrobiae bacterium]|nr:sigma-70 family RNA polymerase sigma factor [Verrucomicrobiae bacterium]